MLKLNLLLLLLSRLLNMFGRRMIPFAFGFYILTTTGSGLSFSISLVATFIPPILISPIAGVLIDKIRTPQKKHVLALSMLASVFVLLISIGIDLHVLSIFITLLLLAGLGSFYDIALVAMIPHVIEHNNEKHLQKTNSLMQIMFSVASLSAPIIGGTMLLFFELSILIALGTVVFFISFVCCIFVKLSDIDADYSLRKHESTDMLGVRGIGKSIIGIFKGLHGVISNNGTLKFVVKAEFITNFFVALGFLSVSSYIFIQHLDMTSAQFGFFQSFNAIGSTLGAVYLLTTKKLSLLRYPLMRVLHLGIIVSTFGLLSQFADFLHNYVILLLLLLTSSMFGFTAASINIPVTAIMQSVSKNEVGKVAGFIGSITTLHIPITLIVSGFAMERINPSLLPIVCGCLLVLFAITRKSTDVC